MIISSNFDDKIISNTHFCQIMYTDLACSEICLSMISNYNYENCLPCFLKSSNIVAPNKTSIIDQGIDKETRMKNMRDTIFIMFELPLLVRGYAYRKFFSQLVKFQASL